jgi:flagellar biosynthesis/type III secretory pathway chaperone
MDGTSPQVMEAKYSLKEIMNREVRLLRELLASLYEEQQAHLSNSAEQIKQLLKTRENLTGQIANERENRLSTVKRLQDLLGISDPQNTEDEHDTLSILMDNASSISCEILSLRDEMLALIDQMTQQGNRNNYLIQGKISHTRELLQQIHPKDPNMTYGAGGSMQKKSVKTKISTINKEG